MGYLNMVWKISAVSACYDTGPRNAKVCAMTIQLIATAISEVKAAC